MNDKSINSLHRNKTGKVSNKWESYLSYYDVLLNSLRNNPVSMLEIGVQNGGSLETWAEYFQSGKCFIGCDIDPKCGELVFDDNRINVVVGDANSSTAFKAIQTISHDFDIVIDDGSHISTDVLNSFVNYFPLVKPGGLYIVEDTHTLYMDQFGGGILNEFGAYAFFKRLVDVISFQFWQDQLSINTYLRTFFPLQSTPQFILDGWIDSIEFRNSIITITKSQASGHNKLGNSILAGNSAKVQDFGGKFSE